MNHPLSSDAAGAADAGGDPRSAMTFPEIDAAMSLPVASPGSAAAADADEPVYVWEYFAQHIDEFAVAKCIVDHFEANPKDLRVPGLDTVDVLGLLLRAKVTLKREQIAYARAERERLAEVAAADAVRKAQASSRSMPAVLRRSADWLRRLRQAMHDTPAVPVTCIALIAVFCHR